MDAELKKQLAVIANTIRQLSMEAVQKANSGHPGLPMGCAEFGAYLYGHLMCHNPKDPKWLARDRFVLSAGHGSMLLYSLLHLAGYNLTMDDIKNFRQLHSKTPGHPEYGMTEGVEATTGPLGQGVGNAVGQAIGLQLLASKFNTERHPIFNNKVYCLAGDGCIMEGISSEASSLAGHLGLNNLVLVYDSNKVTLDGPLPQSCSENTRLRYEAYGWETYEVDGHDFDDLDTTFKQIKASQTRPCLVVMHTTIGKGSPNKAGTYKAHGSPLGEEEVAAAKKLLGLPDEKFYVAPETYDFFAKRLERDKKCEEEWNAMVKEWSQENPNRFAEFKVMKEKKIPDNFEQFLRKVEIEEPIGGRDASNKVINAIAEELPFIYGGSADLSGSDKTMITKHPLISPGHFEGRNFKFGIREFGMATSATGIAQTDMIIPFIGTFFTFSDYMRNAIRLAALSHVQVLYQFTHDSIFLGEDGPTHQSIEHLASLRAMPNLHLIRPADANETRMAWLAALRYKGPTAMVYSRQKLPALRGTDVPFDQGLGRGAYIIKKETKKPDFTLFSTGSEVSLAVAVSEALEKQGKSVRVVSMPCWELFQKQDEEYRKSVVCGDIGKRVAIEAGASLGWHQWIGQDGIAVCMDTFGASAPDKVLAEEFGFTVDAILKRLL